MNGGPLSGLSDADHPSPGSVLLFALTVLKYSLKSNIKDMSHCQSEAFGSKS